MTGLEQLEPKAVFHYFGEISRIPHGTFHTKEISDYCVSFAKEHNLECEQDEIDNIIIRKPGTAGYEQSEPVIIQGHMDMVCEKTEDSPHDFEKDPLTLLVEDGFLTADQTTLGADDGIAMAYAFALLESSDIPHPPLEVVFTVDEEVGMSGAEGLDFSKLTGKRLINIDSDEEGILTTGCAGGLRHTASIPGKKENQSGELFEIQIGGLKGGHSGVEIGEQRGNANKLMGRLLNTMQYCAEFSLVSIEGGQKDNVITTSCKAEILVAEADAEKAGAAIEELREAWSVEFGCHEPQLTVDVQRRSVSDIEVFDGESTRNIVFYIAAAPSGVQGYSRDLEGLVETSLNLGVIHTLEDSVTVAHLIRSSIESRKIEVQTILNTLAAQIKAETTISGNYPGWMHRENSSLRSTMVKVYEEMYGKEPKQIMIHAGLECGLFSGKRPELDCVSMGPNLYDIHSVNERLDIASAARVWDYLKAVLAACK